MNYFRRFRDIAISVALLIFPFLVLQSNLKDPSNVNGLDSFLLRISQPLQQFGVSAAAAVSSVLEEYFFLVDVQRDNERLRIENARYREENRELRLEARENERLRMLLALRINVQPREGLYLLMGRNFARVHARIPYGFKPIAGSAGHAISAPKDGGDLAIVRHLVVRVRCATHTRVKMWERLGVLLVEFLVVRA